MERRQGKFRRNRLKLKDGNRISLPSGTGLVHCFFFCLDFLTGGATMALKM